MSHQFSHKPGDSFRTYTKRAYTGKPQETRSLNVVIESCSSYGTRRGDEPVETYYVKAFGSKMDWCMTIWTEDDRCELLARDKADRAHIFRGIRYSV